MEWVSVSDRLPEIPGMYLTYEQWPGEHGGIISYNRWDPEDHAFIDDEYNYDLYNVTYWMQIDPPDFR